MQTATDDTETNDKSNDDGKVPESSPEATAVPAVESPEAATPETTESKPSGSSANVDDIVKKIIASGKLSPEESKAVKDLLNDHAALKTKIDRLKGLLGRSAKAQREAAVDLKNCQKKLEQALRDVKRLNEKVDRLSSRPTHMDLLNDFETNFDKALLSVGKVQTGGQDTAAPQPAMMDMAASHSAIDTMLLQELEESRQRLAKLEGLNSALMKRSSQLEADAKEKKQALNQAIMKLQNMDLELKMARMEAAHAQRAMEEKAASLEEMQMEIDLVTKASMKANVRAAQGEAVAKSSKTDRQYIIQLESQVQALKEWALASAEAKRLALERVSILEKKLKSQGGKMDSSVSNDEDGMGKVVFSKHGSLVVGAGDVAHVIVEPDDSVKLGTRLLLRWKFDATPGDQATDFSVMKGKCSTPKEQSAGSYLIKDRSVTGGAAGTLEDAFSDQNACTILWSNKKSWVRPRTIKYDVEIMSFF